MGRWRPGLVREAPSGGEAPSGAGGPIWWGRPCLVREAPAVLEAGTTGCGKAWDKLGHGYESREDGETRCALPEPSPPQLCRPAGVGPEPATCHSDAPASSGRGIRRFAGVCRVPGRPGRRSVRSLAHNYVEHLGAMCDMGASLGFLRCRPPTPFTRGRVDARRAPLRVSGD